MFICTEALVKGGTEGRLSSLYLSHALGSLELLKGAKSTVHGFGREDYFLIFKSILNIIEIVDLRLMKYKISSLKKSEF